MADQGRPSPDGLTAPDPVDDYLSLAMLVSTVVPVFGGAVGHVFSEWAAARRVQRLREVLIGVTEDIKALSAQVREEYVRSEEFEDLLDHTLRRVAVERHEEKRRLFRAFLLDTITTAPAYDEQLRVLRALEELQAAHITLLRAVIQEPDPRRADRISGSFSETLTRRLLNLKAEQISDLVAQLNDLRILNLGSLNTMMSARGAEDMRHVVTLFGQRFVKYLLAADREEQGRGGR